MQFLVLYTVHTASGIKTGIMIVAATTSIMIMTDRHPVTAADFDENLKEENLNLNLTRMTPAQHKKKKVAGT